MPSAGWDQSKFDAALKEYLQRHKADVWPKSLNKKAAGIAYKAYEMTPPKQRSDIEAELAKPITGKRADGTTGELPIGYAIAAKRASANWATSKEFRRVKKQFGKAGQSNYYLAWLALLRRKFRSMIGGRKAASGYMRLGWISVLQEMVRQGVQAAGSKRGGARIHGDPKGKVSVAVPNRLSVTMENIAHAKSEKWGNFVKIGEPYLQRAFDAETADIIQYLEGEMKPHAEEFNRSQH